MYLASLDQCGKPRVNSTHPPTGLRTHPLLFKWKGKSIPHPALPSYRSSLFGDHYATHKQHTTWDCQATVKLFNPPWILHAGKISWVSSQDHAINSYANNSIWSWLQAAIPVFLTVNRVFRSTRWMLEPAHWTQVAESLDTRSITNKIRVVFDGPRKEVIRCGCKWADGTSVMTLRFKLSQELYQRLPSHLQKSFYH